MWILGIFVFIIFLYEPFFGILGVVVLVYLIYYNWKSNFDRAKKWRKYIETLSLNIDNAARYAILNLPIPLLLVDFDGKITWYNSKFQELVTDKNLLNKHITDIASGISLDKIISSDGDYQQIKYGDKNYQILHNVVELEEVADNERFIVMLYWLENTVYQNLKEIYKDEKPVAALIQVDNYDDVLKNTKEEKQPFIISEMDGLMNRWSSRMNGILKKYQKDKYLILFENKYLDNLEAKRFTILDDIREIDLGNKIPVTLSIGVGTDGKNLSQLEEYAFSSLELALGRGGDQAVVRKQGNFEFYGGKTKAVEKRNRVKARIIAHAFRPLIDESSKVFIMGHKFPDMDCFGAAVGVFRAVANRGKDGYIILDHINESITNVYKEFEAHEEYNFITSQDALAMIGENDLLVVVDTHRPSFTECPELLEKTDRVVLFDHHRRGTEFIENTALQYTETYASSTSEMITEILQYISNKVHIQKIEAEALLAGIAVDTKNFSFKTGVRTFEAASLLRRMGADTTFVKQLFQDDIETFVAKSNIVSNAELYREEIAISYAPMGLENAQLISAQSADELLNIRGTTTSFVIGDKGDGMIFISGRSLGDVNVQLIMEKLGGGGHLTVAGAQFEESTISEVKVLLIQAIDEYFEEES